MKLRHGETALTTEIQSLIPITLDFTRRGPGLHLGYSQARAALEGNRTGFLRLDAVFPSGVVPTIMRRDDLYLIGFRSQDGWWRFSDADWPLTPVATSLGHDGQYQTLGGLSGSLSRGAMEAAGKLSNPRHRDQWRVCIRTLLIVVAENLRLVPVNMLVLGVLNGIKHSIPLDYVEPYVRNWGKASAGRDMSVQVSPNLKTGFGDPTIIRR
jgi:hypothetical protein